MAVKYLTEEWIAALNEALNAHDGFKGAASGVSLAFQFNVTDVPEGSVDQYYLKIDGGEAAAGSGEVGDSDVGITSNYDTSAAIAKGELNTQTAFMTGKLKVTGNLAKLMMHQNVIQQWGAATESMEVDF
jgi:putative sterol carrier protein